ncbi:MAG: proton-conducting transporter membrane subunit [Nitrososphaerota archaeon]
MMQVDVTPLSVLVISSLFSPLIIIFSRQFRIDKLAGAYTSLVFLYALISSYTFIFIPETLRVSLLGGSSSLAILQIDQLSSYMTLIVLGIALASSIYSLGYIHERIPEFYSLLLLLTTGMVGVFYSGDLLTFFVFWELMSISSYILVAFNYREWEAVEASLKYLIMSSTGSAAILFGVSLIYGMTGTLVISDVAARMTSQTAAHEIWSIAGLVFIIGGLGVNVAMVPFHSWLPDAHPAAPSPISAMLSGVVIKTGVYAMYRLLTMVYPPSMYSWQLGLMLLSILTMTIGNLMAALQTDIKRLLAFSSIANMGYIVFALSIGTELGLSGGLLHVMNHAVSKSLLFLAAGSFIHASGTRNLEEMAGIAKRMPISGISYSIGAFSLAGVPGLNAFVSEYTIIISAFEAGLHILAAIMLINVIIGAMYHLRVVQIIFVKPETEASSRCREPGISIITPLILLSIFSILIGVYASPFLETARGVALTLLNR